MKIRCLVISLCLASLSVAQTAPRPRGPGGGASVGPANLFGPNAETRLTRQLGLDATQQNTLHTALLSANVQQQGVREKMAALRTQLAAAMKAGDESGIDKATQDIAALNQQQAAVQAKTLSKVYGSLRADQRTRFEPQMNRAAGVPVQPGRRGPGGRGPRTGRRAPAQPQQQ